MTDFPDRLTALADYLKSTDQGGEVCREARDEIMRLYVALQGCIDAHKTGQSEPMHIAIEHAENVMADTSPQNTNGESK